MNIRILGLWCAIFSQSLQIDAMQSKTACLRKGQPCNPARAAADGCYFCMNNHLSAKSNPDFNINALNSDGYTLLHYASMCGHPNIVRLLLVYHADRSIQVSTGYYAGKTACELAQTGLGENFRTIVDMLAAPLIVRETISVDSTRGGDLPSTEAQQPAAQTKRRDGPPPSLVDKQEENNPDNHDACSWSGSSTSSWFYAEKIEESHAI